MQKAIFFAKNRFLFKELLFISFLIPGLLTGLEAIKMLVVSKIQQKLFRLMYRLITNHYSYILYYKPRINYGYTYTAIQKSCLFSQKKRSLLSRQTTLKTFSKR